MFRLLRNLGIMLLLAGCARTPVTPTVPNTTPEPTHDTDIEPETPNTDPEATPTTEDILATDTAELEAEVITEERPLPTHTEDDVKLAERIVKLKMKGFAKGLWFECGKKYKKEQIKPAALEWAVALNKASKDTPPYKLRNGSRVEINIIEALGIMQSESRLDRCAVGPYPRKFAYEKGILKRKKHTMSHSLEEIKKAIKHPQFKRRKADIGPGQIVEYLGDMSWEDIAEYLSVTPGVQKVFDAMVYRGVLYNTRKPSLHWPGSKKHHWYYTKIMRGVQYLFR